MIGGPIWNLVTANLEYQHLKFRMLDQLRCSRCKTCFRALDGSLASLVYDAYRHRASPASAARSIHQLSFGDPFFLWPGLWIGLGLCSVNLALRFHQRQEQL